MQEIEGKKTHSYDGESAHRQREILFIDASISLTLRFFFFKRGTVF